MLTVACVYRTGGEYNHAHVLGLHLQVERWLTSPPHRFVCLTDAPEVLEPFGVETLPLPNRWPGWWSKIELFRPGLFGGGNVLYVDLDTMIFEPIDDLAYQERLTVLRNFWTPGSIGSGLMAWAGDDYARLYNVFKQHPPIHMDAFRRAERLGDQGYIQDVLGLETLELWQDRYPGRVVSYRRHLGEPAKRRAGQSIVCFGGPVRPWTTPWWQEIVNAERGGHLSSLRRAEAAD